MNWQGFIIGCVVCLSSAAASEPLLITGKVSSLTTQSVTAPRTDRWQVQIQWLVEEGSVVKEGDVVAIFDSGSLDAQLEQNEDSLETQRLELQSKQMELDQKVLEAEGTLAVASLQVEKARIEAQIDSNDISDYDKGQYQITLERALVDEFKAAQALEKQIQERNNTLEKQRIEITKLEENIAYQQYQLTRLQVTADIAGVVSHMYHPWTGEKITAGTTLQASMKVLKVQDTSSYEIDAWVHEIDANQIRIGQTATITLDAYPQQHYPGYITQQVSQPEKKAGWGDSAYYKIKLAFTTRPTEKLLPGMSVRVVLENGGSQSEE